jgi:NAD-dependent dihydropyrimidine dehydrogenase PreA subunit
MSLIIDNEKCDGCGFCTEVCPVDVIRLDGDRKPYIKYQECWYCGACEKDCPKSAIKLKLPYLIK